MALKVDSIVDVLFVSGLQKSLPVNKMVSESQVMMHRFFMGVS